MMSSVINGHDPETAEMPSDLGRQVVNIFTHLRSAVTAAGGGPDDILKITFWVKDPATGRGALNDEWLAMFPDENARPARHAQALIGDGPALVTCKFTAVFQE